MEGRVIAVAASKRHGFSKEPRLSIRLVAGHGVDGDAHAGATVKHRSRVRVDPTAPNLRQVHLVAGELLEDLDREGFRVGPGDLGENLVTRGIDLLGLPRGAVLRLGSRAVIEVTGLRNPCSQIERFRDGLLARLVGKTAEGRLELRAGIMAIVREGGEVFPDDAIVMELPAEPRSPLERV